MPDQKKILNILSDYCKANALSLGIEEMGLFGSYAKGIADESSDVDVYVRMKKADLLTLSKIRLDLEALLGKRVDIVHLRRRMNPRLKERIERDAISA